VDDGFPGVTAGAADTAGVRRAWGWLAHLGDGGTTPWREWSGEAPSRGRHVPGAQQLETLRRLNLRGAVSPALARRVLEASAPGRGRPDLELTGVADRSGFGPRPVDPADLPDDELVRVATSVLADLVVEAGGVAAWPPPGAAPLAPEAAGPRPGPVGAHPSAPAVLGKVRRRLPQPRTRRYRLVGDPLLADPLREQLVARGRLPGGSGSRVLVLGDDAGSLVADAWTHRALTDGAPPWRDWLRQRTRRRTLPGRVDVLRAAQAWQERVGRDRVHVVLDPSLVGRLVGVRSPLAAPRRLSADAAELARRTGPVLGLLAVPDLKRALVRDVLVPWLADHDGPPLVVPPEHGDWLRGTAVRVRDSLLRDGYAVHGDPDRLLPVERPGVSQPSDAGALELALRLLLEKTR
jgi:hypothetical protein